MIVAGLFVLAKIPNDHIHRLDPRILFRAPTEDSFVPRHFRADQAISAVSAVSRDWRIAQPFAGYPDFDCLTDNSCKTAPGVRIAHIDPTKRCQVISPTAENSEQSARFNLFPSQELS